MTHSNTLSNHRGDILAYIHHPGAESGVLFCGGFRSDMTGSKALFLEEWCKERGIQFTRFDYSGHGESEGEFETLSIDDWMKDTLAILDNVTSGKQIIIGSSMGGWLMLLAAMRRPEKVAGLVGIAAAPDFTEDLMWNAFSPEQKQVMLATKRVLIPNCYDDQEPYPISYHLIKNSKKHRLLVKPLPIYCPVRLIHGTTDKDVPYRYSIKLARQLMSDDVDVNLVEEGDHHMSSPEQLKILGKTLADLLESL
jgi:pimeloyl-ACP methyl ester carboxylesterase